MDVVPASVAPGQGVTFTLVVSRANDGDAGPGPAAGLALTDSLPAGLTYVRGSAPEADYDPAAKRLTWSLPELNAGQALAVSFAARVTAPPGETLTNTATLVGEGLATPPAAPSNLTAQVIRVFIVHLTWTDNSNNEDGFKISRCLDLLCDEILVGPNVTTYDDHPCSGGGQPREGAALPGSTTYAYCVQAYNQGGESACSNTVEATVNCGSITPTGLESTSPSLVSGAVDGAAATQAGILSTLPNGETHRSYYSFNGQRVAMREVDAGGERVLYLLGDHLNSTSLVLNSDGTVDSQGRYYPYGEERWSSGTLPTDYRFTGQRQLAGLGLYQMGARFYDPALGRWLSADTLVPEPGNPQAFNRYSYVRNSPLTLVDPTGHKEEGECGFNGEACHDDPPPPWTWTQFLIDALTFNIFDVGITGETRPTTQINAQIQSAYAKVTAFVRRVTPAPLLKASDDVNNFLSRPEVQMGIQGAMMATGAPPNPELMFGEESYDNVPCFEGGTLVSTEGGQMPIETVRVGDLAFTLDPEIGTAGYFTVTDVFSHHVDSLVEVAIGDDVIRATEEHPFWVVGGGWIGAAALTPGDCIQTRAGGCQPVVSVREIPADTWVYNFTVVNAHTYFVADGEYLVHNQCRYQGPPKDPWVQGKQDNLRWNSRQNQKPQQLNVSESEARWSSMERPEIMQKTVPGASDMGSIPDDKITPLGRIFIALGRIISGFFGGGN
jgi:RHS repeat-associated protein/uncharacterized repeat protein (TIGR01451 family)